MTGIGVYATAVPSEPVSNFKKILVVAHADNDVLFMSKEFYTDMLYPIDPNIGYNAMDGYTHSTNYIMSANYKISDSVIGACWNVNSWGTSVKTIKFYGIKLL